MGLVGLLGHMGLLLRQHGGGIYIYMYICICILFNDDIGMIEACGLEVWSLGCGTVSQSVSQSRWFMFMFGSVVVVCFCVSVFLYAAFAFAFAFASVSVYRASIRSMVTPHTRTEYKC